MLTFKMDNMLVFKNWKMLLKTGLSELLILLIILAMVLSKSSKAGLYIPVLVLLLALYPAFLLSFAQKEILNGSFTWNISGLLPRFFRVQMFWLILTALANSILLFLVAPYTEGFWDKWGLIDYGSFCCIAGLLYVVMAIAVFRFEYSAVFPALAVFGIVFLMTTSAFLHPVLLLALDGFWFLCSSLVLLTVVLGKMVMTKNTQRSLCDRPLLTLNIATSLSKMQTYRAVKNKKLGTDQIAKRPGGKLLVTLLNRVAEAKAEGHHVNSKLWAGMFLFLSTLPRNRLGYILAFSFSPAWLVISGYVDSGISSSLDRWFANLSFLLFATMPSLLSTSLVERSPVLQGRRSREKSGFQFVAWLAGVSLIFPAFIWVLLKIMEANMPKFCFGSREFYFVAAYPEMIFSALFVLAITLIVVARFKPTRNHINITSMTSFYAYIVFFSLARESYAGELPIILLLIVSGISLGLMMVFTVVWRKRCRIWDQ